MAEAVFQHIVNEDGLGDKILVDSAGTGGWHVGEPAHQGTLGVLKEHNVPYNGRARQFARNDLEQFDYVLAMDSENLSNLKPYGSKHAKVGLFLDYAVAAKLTQVNEVPDPYYDGRFAYVYELVSIGCKALLEHIRIEHGI